MIIEHHNQSSMAGIQLKLFVEDLACLPMYALYTRRLKHPFEIEKVSNLREIFVFYGIQFVWGVCILWMF